VKARTAQAKQIRGLLAEFGVVIPQGIARLFAQLSQVLEDATNELPDWLPALIGRRNVNVAAVALANKNARIAWVLLAHDRQHRSDYVAA
jgi:hypothetical protein